MADINTRSTRPQPSFSLVCAGLGCALAVGVPACSSSREQGDSRNGSTSGAPALAPTSSSSGPNPSGPGASTAAGFDVAKNGSTYTATSKKNPQIQVEVDCDAQASDGHYFGITPIIGTRRMDGPLWDTNIGFFTPVDDAGTGTSQCVAVEAVDDRLRVRFTTGSYKNLLTTGPDKPVPMNADFSVDANQRLVAELSGLYYMLPTAEDSVVRVTSGAGVENRTFRQPVTDTLEYFDDVTFLDVTDARFGRFTVETNVVRLQLQHEVRYSRFEFDFDHAYKDRGQENVTSKVTFF